MADAEVVDEIKLGEVDGDPQKLEGGDPILTPRGTEEDS